MPSKRRKIPEAVQAHLERKARLTASMAQRQSAVLGKSARERLKPLLHVAPQSVDAPRVETDVFSETLRRMHDQLLQQMAQPIQWFQPPSTWPALTFRVQESAPTIDAKRLDSLRAAAPHKVKPRVPDMVHVITGWRGWGLSTNGRLQALGQSHVWPAKEALVAECATRGVHIAPSFSCSCGIWAFKDLERLIAAIGSGYNAIKVLGSVSLWGRVIETENGYRAQYAYPSELWLLDDSLEELGLLYDVPIRK